MPDPIMEPITMVVASRSPNPRLSSPCAVSPWEVVCMRVPSPDVENPREDRPVIFPIYYTANLSAQVLSEQAADPSGCIQRKRFLFPGTSPVLRAEPLRFPRYGFSPSGVSSARLSLLPLIASCGSRSGLLPPGVLHIRADPHPVTASRCGPHRTF